MAYLFRAYSDQSQGINTPTLFAPKTAIDHLPITQYSPPKKSTSQLGGQLQDAVAWKKTPSPFIFWTASLFFALQVARSRKRKNETNIRIIALDIRTSKTAKDGGQVTFTPVPTMLKEHGVRLEKKDGTEYDYSNEILTMDCVVPGAESRTVDFEALELHGLYELYPALNWAFERDDGRTRLHRNTVALREFHFQDEQCLTLGRLGVAAALAAMFMTRAGQMDDVDSTILAHLLAIRKRSPLDTILASWIELNMREFVKLDEDEGEGEDTAFIAMIEAIDVEEVQHFLDLQQLFQDKCFSSSTFELTTGTVSKREINGELADWKKWDTQQREKFRGKKESRSDFDSAFKRRERRLPRSSPSSFNGVARNGAYAERSALKVWLPTEQYRAQRDARRAMKGRRGDKRFAALGEASQPSGVYKQRRYGSTVANRAV